MVFTLLVVEQKQGIGALWPGRPVRLENCRTLGVPWQLLRATAGKRGPNWAKIERLAGSRRSRVYAAADCRPPPGSRVVAAHSFALQRLLAAKAMADVLPQGATVAVVDPQARCLSAVELLLQRAACVLVHTNLPHRYEWFARRMLERSGAPVLLCGSSRAVAGCGTVLVGGLCSQWQQWVPRGAVVFSAVGELQCGQNRVVSSFEPLCPPDLLRQMPPGVPPGELCAALYRLAPCGPLAGLQAGQCRLDGRLVQADSLSTALQTAENGAF